MKCLNCFEEIEEYNLVSNEFGVTHCGCFYESNPDKVRWHFMKEIETEDYIIQEFKKEIFDLFNSNDFWLNEKAEYLERKLNCKIETFENLRTKIKKLIMKFDWYDLEKNKYSGVCKVLYETVSEKDDSVTMERLHNLSEMLSCNKLETESQKSPKEDDVVTITMEWKDIYALADTP